MTTMLHVNPAADRFDEQLMTAQLRYVTSSRAQAQSLAENYTGYRPLRFEL
jgi:p-hydroxybenzoate 3-monooxygenase